MNPLSLQVSVASAPTIIVENIAEAAKLDFRVTMTSFSELGWFLVEIETAFSITRATSSYKVVTLELASAVVPITDITISKSTYSAYRCCFGSIG